MKRTKVTATEVSWKTKASDCFIPSVHSPFNLNLTSVGSGITV